MQWSSHDNRTHKTYFKQSLFFVQAEPTFSSHADLPSHVNEDVQADPTHPSHAANTNIAPASFPSHAANTNLATPKNPTSNQNKHALTKLIT